MAPSLYPTTHYSQRNFSARCHHLWFLCAIILELFPSTPVIAIFHGTDICQAINHPALAQKYVGSLHSLSQVFALSSLHIHDLLNLFSLDQNQIQVTGGAFDSAIFYPGDNRCFPSKEHPVSLIYAGKMSEAKGIYELAQSFTLLRKKDLPITLILIDNQTSKSQQALRQITQRDEKYSYP